MKTRSFHLNFLSTRFQLLLLPKLQTRVDLKDLQNWSQTSASIKNLIIGDWCHQDPELASDIFLNRPKNWQIFYICRATCLISRTSHDLHCSLQTVPKTITTLLMKCRPLELLNNNDFLRNKALQQNIFRPVSPPSKARQGCAIPCATCKSCAS